MVWFVLLLCTTCSMLVLWLPAFECVAIVVYDDDDDDMSVK